MSTNTLNENSCILRLDLSTWTGKAKLTAGDLPPGTNLPPEELADLGTKRLIDPVTLRPFGKVKTRATRLMEQYALRFIGGWLIDRKYLADVEIQLTDLKNEFDMALTSFVDDYEKNVNLWCLEYPQWEHIIRNAMPQPHDVARRFGMAWQVYSITPLDTGKGNNLQEQLDNVGTYAVESLAHDIADLKEQLFADRSAPLTNRTLQPIKNLGDKCRRLELFNPEAAYVGDLLNQLAGIDTKDGASIVELVLGQLSDPATLQGLVDAWKTKGASVFDTFRPSPTTPTYVPDVDPTQFLREHVIITRTPMDCTTFNPNVTRDEEPAQPEPLPPTRSATPKSGVDGLAALLDGLF